jgi:hypothetical protein
MFSYLNPTATSSTSSSQPTDVTALKRGMLAIPSTSVRSSSRKRRGKTQLITSKSFNIVASRPNAQIRNPTLVYPAMLSYTISSVYTTSTVAPTLAALSFALSAFAEYTDYTGLFDQYRFDDIEVWLEPQPSQSTAIANTGQYVTAVDLDDVAAPGSYNAAISRQNALVTGGEAGHYHRWLPHMAVAVYSGAFTSFANEEAGWIDCGSPNVQHYGIKLAFLTTSVAVAYNLSVRAKISFRSAGI